MTLITYPVLFCLYYSRLRLAVLLGYHETAHPLNLNWRWNHWKYKKERSRAR